MRKVLLSIFLISIFMISSVSAAHFIVGEVEDSKKGVSPDGLKILLWKKGDKQDFLVTTVTNNSYIFDCEQLGSLCTIGDKLIIRVIDGKHISQKVELIVGGSGFDIADTIRLRK